jgi:phosphate:Na+ symporter
MVEITSGMIDDVLNGLESNDIKYAKRALKKEDLINQMQVEYRNSHVKRLNNGSCEIYSGLLFLDCVDYMEKIGDHLANIAQGLLGGFRWE